MSIRDFHSKLFCPKTENALFRVLRKLSQAEDAQSLLTQTSDESGNWGEWSTASLPGAVS